MGCLSVAVVASLLAHISSSRKVRRAQPSLHSPQLYRERDAPRQRAAATRRRETDEARPYMRVHRCSSTSTCPRKRYATRRAVRYIHTYIPYHLQRRNNELMKFIPANRVNSTGSTAARIYEYTAAAVPVRAQGNGTPPGEL